jgi:hypothetical protein
MAITKRKTTGAKRKPAAKRKRRVSGTASTDKVKIAGVTFSKTSCHGTKTEAAKQADRIRAQGNNARVIKSGKLNCVFKGGKTKATAPRALARRRKARA